MKFILQHLKALYISQLNEPKLKAVLKALKSFECDRKEVYVRYSIRATKKLDESFIKSC